MDGGSSISISTTTASMGSDDGLSESEELMAAAKGGLTAAGQRAAAPGTGQISRWWSGVKEVGGSGGRRWGGRGASVGTGLLSALGCEMAARGGGCGCRGRRVADMGLKRGGFRAGCYRSWWRRRGEGRDGWSCGERRTR
ncbi:uncharacterized protein A4U43_C08F27770 [Asparagus officinalis]|nr:uncharacterized protein A4U43_C08F27770 [Asparagus officinalis]